jgi:hypothetical protein
MTHIRQLESMNGHVFRIDNRNSNLNTIRRSSGCCELCDCRRITGDTSQCSGCRQTLCDTHWKSIRCSSDYGSRMIAELKSNCIGDELNALSDDYR